ncbi:hypothetical protein [Falsarthrobacter nasiphocae]|uniref:Membrane protein YczE n=1 Tax=Falsarthrobacter nasiphocae TaxID=189863 RepID=A0AAE3YH34_9MICC|nr:hypothetical protein [Falsarthrobacter nasiphocae]MDR6891881.1 putative membrane protein YczE [Falsarthrobacter nasiphocae]
MPTQYPRRFVQLFVSLWLLGMSVAVMVRAHVGLAPWDVLHQGLAARLGVSIGSVVIGVGVVVLLLWIPLRQRPGIGTVANTILIGVSADATLVWLPEPESMWARVPMLLGGVLLNGAATAGYIGARLGPGPRDGLMTGLVRVTGLSTRIVRTGIEIGALLIGWALGGTLGVGTVVFALGIGPVVHWLLPIFEVKPPAVRTRLEQEIP